MRLPQQAVYINGFFQKTAHVQSVKEIFHRPAHGNIPDYLLFETFWDNS